MSIKYDINATYIQELIKYQELLLKVRTSTGNPTFTSTSSSVTYTVSDNGGENSLLGLLQTALTDYSISAANYNSLLLGTSNYFLSTTGNDSYAITGYGILDYTNGMRVLFKPDVSNTGSASMSIDGLTAKTIIIMNTTGFNNLSAGDIISGGVYMLVYQSPYFILMNPLCMQNSLFTAQGDMVYASLANNPAKLGLNGAYKGLITNSGNTAPMWGDSLQSLMTAKGDIIIASTPNTPVVLPVDSTANKALISDGTTIVYGYPDGVRYGNSNNIILTDNSEIVRYSVSPAPSKTSMRSFATKYSGTVRVKFDAKTTYYTSSSELYINSTVMATGLSTNYTSYQFDIAVDCLEGYTVYINPGNSYGIDLYLKNMTVCADEIVLANSID
jgi:hypothetical protein